MCTLKGIGLSVWLLESLQTHIKGSLVLCWTWKIVVSNLKLAKISQIFIYVLTTVNML